MQEESALSMRVTRHIASVCRMDAACWLLNSIYPAHHFVDVINVINVIDVIDVIDVINVIRVTPT